MQKRNKYQKFIDELFARVIEVNELKQITLGSFFEELKNDPNLNPLTNFEFNEIGSLEVGESTIFRTTNIKRTNRPL